MKNNKMCGSDKFFTDIENLVVEYINAEKFSPEEFSDILFAFSVRGNLSEKLKNLFNNYIEKNIDRFISYHAMHNLFYYFMFIDLINMDICLKLISAYEENRAKLPLVYYRAFKLFDYYLSNCANKEKLLPLAIRLREKFYYAEQIYDFVKYERVYGESEEIQIFDDILKVRLFKEPITCLVKNNLLIIHFCFPQYNMGINVWADRNLVPKTNGPKRLNQLHLLHSKLLKMKNWEILDLVWDDYTNLGDQIKKDEFIHNWYENTKILQHNKGICNIKPKFI